MIITALFVTAVSCKENNTKEEKSTEVEEVAETNAVSLDYNVDLEASTITWKGSKPLGTHNGTIALASGTLSVRAGEIEAGKFSIDMNSITDLDLEGDSKTRLENHLKGTVEGKEGDFFNVTKYPFANFQLTGISENGGKTMVSGELTIRDQTHSIEFPAEINFDERTLELKSEPFMLDRTKWGVNFKSKSIFDNLGDNFIDDEMEITIHVIARES